MWVGGEGGMIRPGAQGLRPEKLFCVTLQWWVRVTLHSSEPTSVEHQEGILM